MENKRCFIICAGDYYGLPVKIKKEDYVIAADAGLTICDKEQIDVNLVIGDFDSLGSYPDRSNVVQLPVEKDDTDTLHAVRMALKRGYQEIFIIAGTGGERFDHTMANIQTLLFIANNGGRGYLFDRNNVYTVIRNTSIKFDSDCCGTISVFCLDGIAEGVSIKGLKYEVEKAVISSDYPIGVSNSFVGRNAEISVRNGALFVVSGLNTVKF